MASFATRFDSLEVPDDFPLVSELSAIRHIVHNVHALSALRQRSYTQLSNSELRPEIIMTATKILDTVVCFSPFRSSISPLYLSSLGRSRFSLSYFFFWTTLSRG